MSTARFATAAFLLFSLGNLFAGCSANNVGMPPGAYPSSVECTSTLQCRLIQIPKCTKNMKQCYEGHCLISDIPGCVVPPVPATATATAIVPTAVPPN